MRFALFLFASALSVSALASFDERTALESDPRNTSEYRMLFDVSAESSAEVVDKFGGYMQVFVSGGATTFRFCDNFEGRGMSGRPNPAKTRKKLVPIGTKDPTAYRCHEFSEAQAAAGVSLIPFGDRIFLAMKSIDWTTARGGQLLFKFAKKIPLLGSPTYKTIRVRATRESGPLAYTVETLVPRGPVITTDFMHFNITGSSLGFPNGVSAIILNRGTATEHSLDLNNLEGPFAIRRLHSSRR